MCIWPLTFTRGIRLEEMPHISRLFKGAFWTELYMREQVLYNVLYCHNKTRACLIVCSYIFYLKLYTPKLRITNRHTMVVVFDRMLEFSMHFYFSPNPTNYFAEAELPLIQEVEQLHGEWMDGCSPCWFVWSHWFYSAYSAVVLSIKSKAETMLFIWCTVYVCGVV